MTDMLDNYPNGDEVFIEDFRYTFEPVPEPATFVLAAAAFAGLAVWARRRNRRSTRQ